MESTIRRWSALAAAEHGDRPAEQSRSLFEDGGDARVFRIGGLVDQLGFAFEVALVDLL